MGYMLRKLLTKRSFVFAFLLCEGIGYGVCTSLVQGELAYDISYCGVVSPEKTFQSQVGPFAFIEGLSSADKRSLFESYRGLYLKGKVVRSVAQRSGLTPEKNALNGEEITAFIAPGSLQCGQILNKRVKAQLKEVCCEGGATPPCLLGTSYLLQQVEILGGIKGGAGNPKRMKLQKNLLFSKANEHLRKRQFVEAISAYKKLEASGSLDTRGRYFLAFALRTEDRCDEATKVLKPIYDSFLKNSYWANEEKVVRRATFLYGRCLAKLGLDQEAVSALESFLAHPKKYREEIKASMEHEDFGRLKTNKVYLNYQEAARRVLAAG